MVRADLQEAGTEMDISILGKMYRAVVIEESPYDPANVRLRA
jgi:dimethylglycine dehydrogenase